KCPVVTKVEMSGLWISAIIRVSGKAPAVQEVWERAVEDPWRGSDSEPWSAAQASAVCRSLARGALTPGDELSWLAPASASIALYVAGAAPSDSTGTGCGSSAGSIRPDFGAPLSSGL